MAKIRVYELAKDLNMTNRELLEKVADLSIEVNSHMSSLDDESVNRIKRELLGNSDKKMDEKRVHSTVIRRRKKTKNDLKISLDKVKEDITSLDPVTVSKTVDFKSKNNDLFSLLDETETKSNSISKGVKAKRHYRKNINSLFDEPAKVIAKPNIMKSDVINNINVVESRSKINITHNLSDSKDNNKELKSFSSTDRSKLNEERKSIVAPSNKKATSILRRKNIKKSFHDSNVRLSGNKENLISKSRKNRFKKDTFSKVIKQKDAPAKIIKRADPLKIDPVKKVVASKSLLFKNDSTVAILETVVRKNQKKRRVFKKKEVVEGLALHSGKRKIRRSKKGYRSKQTVTGQKTQITTAKAIKRRIKIDETIVLSDLAKRLGIKANEMISKLMSMGVMVTVNQTIDFDTACLVANEFSYEVEKASFEEGTILKKMFEDDPSKMIKRPPVVTIMGHVDHGKTSLLDVIRKTRVTEGEAGGITQHIGAYHVETEKGVIAFLDTPGHEAFSAMRSRGAKVTDLVILVVAADDGVMPQTVEAINHSKASKVPILVAINKMDKLDANPERVLRELSEQGLVPEEWGGDLISVKVSAKQNQGIDDLLDMILLQAEMLELMANPNKLARGHVVESRLDSGRGPVATVLVQEGTLRSGDSVICGMHYGKIRALQNDIGYKVKAAGPSMPVEIIGLSGVPMAGDELVALEDEKDARQVSIHRTQKQRSKELARTNRLSLEGLFERMQKGEVKDLNIIIKADVDGSIEALKDSLIKLSNEEVSITIVHSATGTISESDVSLAAVSNAIIIGFNVRPNAKVQEFALDEHVDMRFYEVIYNVIKDVKDAILGMMDSTYEERLLGRTDVRQVFHVPKIGTIAGCYVTDGKIVRSKLMRLLRDGVVIYKGKNSSLRRFKEDIKEVHGGYECGIGIENFNDIKVGDVIESYYMEEIKPEIN